MFDIKEYFFNYQYKVSELGQDIIDLDEDVSSSIDDLVQNRYDNLYVHDRYKYSSGAIEIIYPSLAYPKSTSLIFTPDKMRYLLSFYPHKSDLKNVGKIVMRPRFVDAGDIELISLFLRRTRTLVMYLFHPHFYRMTDSKFNAYTEFNTHDLERYRTIPLNSRSPLSAAHSELYIHPLWYIISLLEPDSSDRVDKFFIKRHQRNNALYESLNDISFYYSQHGY